MTLKNIALLCKVIDNYGDAGFVYRLARALSDLKGGLDIRIIIDGAGTFLRIASGENKFALYDWNDAKTGLRAFCSDIPPVIIECFQCGRPDWLETLLFSDKAECKVTIVHIDYLTAEPYADDFHLLPSLTRSSRIKKINFMPGFTSRTGGLVLDAPFMKSRECASFAVQTVAVFVPNIVQYTKEKRFIVVIFSYKRNFVPVVSALAAAQKQIGSVIVLLADGGSSENFLKTWKEAGKPFPIEQLPFIRQTAWDSLLCLSDFSFVRGEDSLSRACLIGHPFVWHAYLQKDDYQLVKVHAALYRMKPYFSSKSFAMLEKCWTFYNKSGASIKAQEALLIWMLCFHNELSSSFKAFADDVVSNGDLALHLLDFIENGFAPVRALG